MIVVGPFQLELFYSVLFCSKSNQWSNCPLETKEYHIKWNVWSSCPAPTHVKTILIHSIKGGTSYDVTAWQETGREDLCFHASRRICKAQGGANGGTLRTVITPLQNFIDRNGNISLYFYHYFYLGITEFCTNINSCLSPTPYTGMSSHDRNHLFPNQDK